MNEKTIIIADTGNNRVCVLSQIGKFMHTFGGSSSKNGFCELSGPEDVIFNPTLNSVIVADTGF